MNLRIGVIILAAGTSRRMGQQKLLLPLGNEPLLGHVLIAVTELEWDDCIVIIGEPQKELMRVCSNHKVRAVYNKERLKGQALSIVLGLQHLAEDLDGVLFLVGDQPLISSQLLQTMRIMFTQANDERTIVVPYCNGQSYSPVLFGAHWRQALTELTGDQGGRRILRANPEWVTPVMWEDPRTFYDADTWEEYQKLCAERQFLP